MRFKVAIKYLNITNYPHVEEYLEGMASKGWLLRKIIGGSLFIFKRIKPERLKFSISPYEVETAFTRKSKEELKEFESVCENIGWNYCTRSYDLHIYYRPEKLDILDLHTDKEEEFNLLERIGKKQIRGYYFLLPFLLFWAWFFAGKLKSIEFMQSAMYQIPILLVPIGLVLIVYDWAHIRQFLKVNRQNIDLGKELEYSQSRYYIIRSSFIIAYLGLTLMILSILYEFIVLGDKVILIGFVPILLGLLIGQVYRNIIKPRKYSRGYKIGIFILGLVGAIILSNAILFFNLDNFIGDDNNPDRTKYRLLLDSDFVEQEVENRGYLTQHISIIVPKSYDYISSSLIDEEEVGYMETKYSKALNESIAKLMIERYKDKGDTINQADNNLWNVDEAYLLRDDRHEIILRTGKDVFYLSGRDFGDSSVIEITKQKLNLN